MKKKILISLLTFILTITTGLKSASALEATSTVSFYKENLQGVTKQSGIANTYYKYVVTPGRTAAMIGYCLDAGKKSPDTSSELSLMGEITVDYDPKYLFIVENGFSTSGYNASIMGAGLSNHEAYYATQIAFWLAQGTYSTNQITKDKVGNAAIALYTASLSATGHHSYWMDVAVAGLDLKLNNEKTQYVSDEMHIVGNGFGKYQVYLNNAPEGAKLVRKDGSVIASGTTLTFTSNETTDRFYLVVPVDKATENMTMFVGAKASVPNNKLYRYTSNDSTRQDIGILVPDTDEFNKGHTFKVVYQPKEKEKKLVINKQDVTTKASVSGATLAIKNANGEIVKQWVTDGKSYVINGLAAGNYSLVEVVAPEGYELSTEVVEFTLGEEYNKTLTFYNKQIPSSKKLVVHKQDATTKAELAGAKLAIKDQSGNVVKEWITDGNPYVITDLPAGTYKLVELASPEGYELGDDVIEFTLEGDDYNKEVVMFNSPIPVTADMNFALIIAAFVIFLGFGVFGLIKASKKEA